MKKIGNFVILAAVSLIVVLIFLPNFKWKYVMNSNFSFIKSINNENVIWVGESMHNRLFQVMFDGNQIRTLREIQFPNDFAIANICISDYVWVVANNRIYAVSQESGEWEGWAIDESVSVKNCIENEEGDVEIVGYKDQKFVLIQDIESDAISIDILPQTGQIIIDSTGTHWLLSENEGLWSKVEGGQWEKMADISGEEIYITNRDELWILSNGFLYLATIQASGMEIKPIDNINFELHSYDTSIVNMASDELLISHENTIWRYDGSDLKEIQIPRGCSLYDRGISYESNQNRLVISTSCGIFAMILPENQ